MPGSGALRRTIPGFRSPSGRVPFRMSLLSRLALLFVGIPLLELLILVQLGQVVGFWPTVGLVVFTGFAGAALARLEGLRTLLNIQSELARGRLPGNALFDGLAILVGGALLLTPGILTDFLGFSFLFPPTRKLLLGMIRKRLEGQLANGAIRVTNLTGFSGGFGGGWGPGPVAPDGPTAEGGEIIVEAEEVKGDPTPLPPFKAS